MALSAMENKYPERKAEEPLGNDISTDATLGGNDTTSWHSKLKPIHIAACLLLLLANYFLAQYDKFILSYFQTPLSRSIGLSTTEYGVLSGYATGIVYALFALPLAYLADTFKSARVWVLTVASLWWSLCVIFQSLSNNFWVRLAHITPC